VPSAIAPTETLFSTLAGPDVLDQYTQPTIVRVHLDLVIWIGDFTLGNTAIIGAGVQVVEPTEAPPDPTNPLYIDGNAWMWWSGFSLTAVLNSPEVPQLDTLGVVRRTIDIRSMRRVPAKGSSLLLVWASSADSTATANVNASASVLIKE